MVDNRVNKARQDRDSKANLEVKPEVIKVLVAKSKMEEAMEVHSKVNKMVDLKELEMTILTVIMTERRQLKML